MQKQFIYILFILLPNLLFSQAAILEKDKIIIGDQITFSLQIDKNKGKDIQFPVFENNIIEGIEIIEHSDIESVDKGKRLRQSYIITSFDDSLFLIKPFKFIVDGKELETNPLRLQVSNYQPDSAFISKIDTTQQIPIADIKPPLETPMTFKEFFKRFWIYILIILIGIASFLIIKHIIKKRKANQPIFAKPKPKIPAHIPALKKLETLKQEELHKKNDLKPFYTKLSTIIRTYIEDRFKISALESITSEIINDFKQTEFATDDINSKLKDLLSLSDTVKFAKNKPDDYRNEMMIEYAFSFVNHTKEIEVTKEELKTENKD
ncbi:MAG: hypothetical protein L3J35_11165 [Bacteroidales bacterium]|nr:hypothetical protein [Bacteroidales bacterium]